MDAKKISIVLPTYNGAKYIRSSIESCLNQTYQNWELIIVNDASTDGTPQIASEYIKKDQRISLINHKINQKLPRTLNTGFKLATGDYFTWISDDNYYYKNALENLAKILDSDKQIDIVYSNIDLIDAEGQYIKTIEVEEAETLRSINAISACFLYRKKVAEILGEYNPNLFLVEDYDFWIRAFLHGFRFKRIPESYYSFRQHDYSLSAQKRIPIFYITQQLLRKHFFYQKLPSKIELSKRPFFIWGTGKLGIYLFNICKSFRLPIEGFIDNAAAKWNSKIDGITVYSPNYLLSDNKQKPYILLGSTFIEPIQKDLIKLGFEQEIDFTVNVNDIFLQMFPNSDSLDKFNIKIL